MALNEITWIGFAGKDGEVFRTPNGIEIGNFSLAISEKNKKTGEEDVTWLKFKAFGEYNIPIVKGIKKGDKVFVKAKLKQVKWKDKNTGLERETYEGIAFQIGVFSRDHTSSSLPSPVGHSGTNSAVFEKSIADDIYDQIPF